MDLTSLICIDKIGHSLDLGIALVSMTSMNSFLDDRETNLRFGFLAVERIYFAACKHVGQNKVFENLNTLR